MLTCITLPPEKPVALPKELASPPLALEGIFGKPK
jgi:hypothetical protein